MWIHTDNSLSKFYLVHWQLSQNSIQWLLQLSGILAHLFWFNFVKIFSFDWFLHVFLLKIRMLNKQGDRKRAELNIFKRMKIYNASFIYMYAQSCLVRKVNFTKTNCRFRILKNKNLSSRYEKYLIWTRFLRFSLKKIINK